MSCTDSLNIIVTTSIKYSNNEEMQAMELADQLGYRYCMRNRLTINSLIKRVNAKAALVVELGSIRLVYNKKSYSFHPNMAQLRVEALIKGKNDRLIDICNIKEGDKVLDCTCGLASDSIVLSYAVGEEGMVTALEASPALFSVVNKGLRSYEDKKGTVLDAMRRVNLLNINFNEYLEAQETNSYDIVYFDPMFENTFSKAHGIDIVRSLASYDLPSQSTIHEAKRVARRAVIIKDGFPGLYLKKMGIPLVSRSRKIVYGKISV